MRMVKAKFLNLLFSGVMGLGALGIPVSLKASSNCQCQCVYHGTGCNIDAPQIVGRGNGRAEPIGGCEQFNGGPCGNGNGTLMACYWPDESARVDDRLQQLNLR